METSLEKATLSAKYSEAVSTFIPQVIIIPHKNDLKTCENVEENTCALRERRRLLFFVNNELGYLVPTSEFISVNWS